MSKHAIIIAVETEEDVNTLQLAEDIAFTMGLEGGVAGGYIGEPTEHAFYKATRIKVFTTNEVS